MDAHGFIGRASIFWAAFQSALPGFKWPYFIIVVTYSRKIKTKKRKKRKKGTEVVKTLSIFSRPC